MKEIRLLRDGIAVMLKEQRDIRVIAASRNGENTLFKIIYAWELLTILTLMKLFKQFPRVFQ